MKGPAAVLSDRQWSTDQEIDADWLQGQNLSPIEVIGQSAKTQPNLISRKVLAAERSFTSFITL